MNKKALNALLLATLMLAGCGEEKCYESKEAAVRSYLDFGRSQSVMQIATGETRVTILNSSTDLVFKITKLGIKVKTSAGLGGDATRFRNVQILLKPGERHQDIYNLDLGDKVQSAYPLMDNIKITCARSNE